jgi:hypothetical protein
MAHLQMLKFGQIIDLEVLDRVGVALDEEEVRFRACVRFTGVILLQIIGLLSSTTVYSR